MGDKTPPNKESSQFTLRRNYNESNYCWIGLIGIRRAEIIKKLGVEILLLLILI